MGHPPDDLDFRCSVILQGQLIAAVAANELPELSELSQREVFLNHPEMRVCVDVLRAYSH